MVVVATAAVMLLLLLLSHEFMARMYSMVTKQAQDRQATVTVC